MAPYDLAAQLGVPMSYLVYLAIGFAFGFILESSGFGDARKLAAQFYFRDLTVIKVMFTAIVVAMVLVFLSTALGFLDYDEIWVNPTYLWPGILGGLIMGFGFIIGGYCPGTSLVSMATLKLDGMFFVFGVVVGVLAFGETVGHFNDFWHSGSLGRFTVPELFNLPTGVTVVLIVLMALVVFWCFGLVSNRIYGAHEDRSPLTFRVTAAVTLVLIAGLLVFFTQPGPERKWDYLASEYESLLHKRSVYIDPAELLNLINDNYIDLIIFDVRNEQDWNQFHLVDAVRVPLEELAEQRKRLLSLADNSVIVVVSNDEIQSTRAWKHLMAIAKPNAYILEGGINHWINIYGTGDDEIADIEATRTPDKDGSLRHQFKLALGGRHAASRPDEHHAPQRHYTPKVRLLRKVARAGGCN